MKFNLESRQLISLVKWVVFLNIFFLAGTFLFYSYYIKVQEGNWENGSYIKYFLLEFSLANENVLATWYSSMLFLFIGIIFFICYLIQKKEYTKRSDKNLSYGWLFFTGIFALLSLDEIASLHERLGNINALIPTENYASGWVVLLGIPIILVAGFMVWFCLLQIKRAPMATLFAVAGIFLFLSVPVQEYYELQTWKAAEDMASWQRPVEFLLLEEGSELFGATCMMISGFIFVFKISNCGKNPGPGSSIALNLQFNKRNTLFQWAAGSLVLASIMLAIVNNDILNLEGEITDLGKRENWFPSATAFFSSLLSLYLYLNPKSSYPTSPKVFLYLCIFCMLISVYYGGNIYGFMYSTKESLLKMSLVAFLALTALGLAIKLFFSVKDHYARGAIFLWACLLIPAFGIFSWHAAALTFTGFSFLSVSLLHIITSKVPVASTPPVT